ncbi:phospholipase A2 inhibitor and Ly6/PLAUR domain-containing protein-like [Ambystoma mexicanum]|uniref:Sodefrin-like factor n=1 Tax=Ambystoma mexicanum TaxID=8296 RepID=A0A125S9L4_AMBME|nr:sodefrin precursor-like factor [Ambystoma mexicanum]
MRAFIGRLGLLFAFVVAGNSIVCEVCRSWDGIYCSGQLETCGKSVKSCQISISELRGEHEKPIYNVFKNCSEPAAKSAVYRVAMVGTSYQKVVHVCREDGCNKLDLQFQPNNSTLNGVKCPSCYAKDETSCEMEDIINCTGDMTRCIFVAATFRLTEGPPFRIAYKACANLKHIGQFPVVPTETIHGITALKLNEGL